MLTIDKLFHFAGGSILGKGFELLGLSTTDNAIASFGLMVAKEATDSVFCWVDILWGVTGWIVTVL